MSKTLVAVILFILAPVSSIAQEFSKTYIIQGDTKVIEFASPNGRYVVGDTEVVSLSPISAEAVYLTGLKHGSTNIQIFGIDKTTITGSLAIQVGPDLLSLKNQIKNAIPRADVKVDVVDETIFASGTLPREQDVSLLQTILNAVSPKPAILTTFTKPDLVSLDVRVIEVKRSYSVDLGPELYPYNSDLVGSNTSVSGGVISRVMGQNDNVFVLLDFLEERGYARTLSRPVLSTVSDKTGSFLAGGEVPVTTVVDGTTSTEYKKFGVLLEYTPSVQPDGTVAMDIAPEVSSVDFANTVDGKPQFSTRRVQTSVNLESGSSLILAGLFQSSDYRNLTGAPFLARLPLIGGFFRNAGTRDEDTELVVIVTPQIGSIDNSFAEFSTVQNSTAASVAQTIGRGQMERSAKKYLLKNLLEGDGISGQFGPVLSGVRGIYNAE